MKKILIFASLLTLLFSCNNYSWKKDYKGRLLCDFNKRQHEVKEYIQKYIPNVTDDQIAEWTKSGKLEAMEIDGDLLYFHNAAPNLFRIDKQCKDIKEAIDGTANPERQPMTTFDKENLKNMDEIIASNQVLSSPKRMRVKYTLTVHPNVVPQGKTVRCWLPFPRKDVARQRDVKFLRASCKVDALNYFNTEDIDSKLIQFSDSTCKHSSLYMEAKAIDDFPIVFEEEFEYTSYGELHKDLENKVLPYDKESNVYKEFTAERDRHIIFTNDIKHLADSLTEGISNPYLQTKAMFEWINKTYPWASAREYSTISNIPEYVIRSGHGDCGQVTLLLITMCRYKGIPAHFQSGFMMEPGAWNLHDWAEVYFEGVGWVPVDQSFGIPDYIGLNPPYEKEFFFLGGIDSWRMVVNNDYGMKLSPQKKYPRSETVDFQRGEVEWDGGNLYFNSWDWNMKITYL